MNRFVVSVMFCLVASAAVAEERQFNIQINETNLNYLGKLLGKQPYEEVAALIQGIQQQVSNQLVKEQAEKAELERLKKQPEEKKE